MAIVFDPDANGPGASASRVWPERVRAAALRAHAPAISAGFDQDALARLPFAARAAVLLHDVEHYRVIEIAEGLQQVETRTYDALNRQVSESDPLDHTWTTEYDAIGQVFGRARPATGFSTDLRSLMRLGARQLPAATDAIAAPAETLRVDSFITISEWAD